MRRSLRFGLTCAFGWFLAAPVAAQPPVWIVHGPHATIVLFGSVHLLPPGLDWRPPALDRALSRADELWFEIPLDPASELAASRAALSLGRQPPGHTLSADLGAAQRARLTADAKACGQPVEALDAFKPWLADVTLSVTCYIQAGATIDDGVEHQIDAATPVNTARRAFETPAEQIRALASASQADQIASLDETLTEIEEGPTGYDRLVRAWMAGDIAGLSHEAVEPMIAKAPGVYRALVIERNRRWLGIIRRRLNGRGEAVMVVGVGHLVGPDGLPAQLRAAGLQVDGP